MPKSAIEKHIKIEDDDITVIQHLSNAYPNVSKQKLKQALTYGAVWSSVENKTLRIRRAKKIPPQHSIIHCYYNPEILFTDIPAAKLVADEGNYSVWNKPSGMFSQGTKWGDHTAIARWVELFGLTQNSIAQRPTFLVHRLDRATSGLILIAHSKKMAKQLSQLFENRQVTKKYRAVVTGKFPQSLVGQLIETTIDSKKAVSLVESVELDKDNQRSQLIVEIKTGRKHQIRKHLSGLGYPIIGDRLYNPEFQDPNRIIPVSQPDLMLQSCYLQFVCPKNKVTKQYQLEGDYNSK
ncbi:MAG: RNA pseudouridine synthase [Enterobacterales bacterium]|nr:RNA pseudouridine synthase [Enterobacterales bacterium]